MGAKGQPLPQLQEQLTQESMEGVEPAEGETSWGRPGAQEPGAKRSRDSDGGSDLSSHKSLKPAESHKSPVESLSLKPAEQSSGEQEPATEPNTSSE